MEKEVKHARTSCAVRRPVAGSGKEEYGVAVRKRQCRLVSHQFLPFLSADTPYGIATK
jgi:hypothetical protein